MDDTKMMIKKGAWKMRKILTGVIILTLTFSTALCAQETSSNGIKELKTKDVLRKEVWKEFHKVRYEKYNEFQKIDIYAENSSLTKICYICDKGLFIYYHKDPNSNGKSRIEQVQHAKMIMYDTINRITYEKDENVGIGFFILWHYETKELMVGG